jgi:hypothetical protein
VDHVLDHGYLVLNLLSQLRDLLDKLGVVGDLRHLCGAACHAAASKGGVRGETE